MKAYLEAKKHESVLLGDVSRHIQSLPDHRDATVIHPSEMAKPNWCPRATWHRLSGHPLTVEVTPLPLGVNLIFETGTQSGEKWQKWLGDMGILWGKWRCECCGEVRLGWSNELVGLCPVFKDAVHHWWKYREVPLGEGLIGGHADGVVNPTGDESLILENKTIGPGTLRLLDLADGDESDDDLHNKFSKITKILPSHFRQTQIYLRLAQHLSEEIGPVTRAVVIYEYKADQQVREFVIEYDPRWTEHMWETAEDIRWAIDKGREVKCPYGGCPQCAAYEEAS